MKRPWAFVCAASTTKSETLRRYCRALYTLGYDYTSVEQAADDLPGEAADWELLDMDDFLPQPKPPQPQFRTIQSKTKRRSAYESHVSEKQKPAE